MGLRFFFMGGAERPFVPRQVCAVALQHGWPVPTYQCVYRVVKHPDPTLLMLAHDGTKAYRTTFDLLSHREAGKPNEIWQADHTLLDLWVRHDGGQPARPWLTVMMDDYSRAIAGFGVSVQAPSAIQTASARHDANRGMIEASTCSREYGHDVRLMAPQFIKASVKSPKHEARDAEAVCEAVT